MLHVVFLILKILGILFLSILGLFLLLLCAALFVPVRYQLDMEKQEQVRVTVRAGWLFRFLFVKYELRWPEEEALWQNLCFRILGIPVFRPFRKKKKKREKGKPEPGKENNTDIGKNAGSQKRHRNQRQFRNPRKLRKKPRNRKLFRKKSIFQSRRNRKFLYGRGSASSYEKWQTG